MQKPVNYNSNTTDPQDELLCHVTEDDKLIGPIKRRICHNETSRPWHRTVHLYLFDKKGRLYLTKRSQNKDVVPGKWTVSAGGHVNSGQTYIEAVREETNEELNLRIDFEILGKINIEYETEREIITIFAAITSKEPTIDKEETSKIKTFDLQKIIKKFKTEKFDLSINSRDSFRHIIKTGSLIKFWKKNFPTRSK